MRLKSFLRPFSHAQAFYLGFQFGLPDELIESDYLS